MSKKHLNCTLMKEYFKVMEEPVKLSDGFVYEEIAIKVPYFKLQLFPHFVNRLYNPLVRICLYFDPRLFIF